MLLFSDSDSLVVSQAALGLCTCICNKVQAPTVFTVVVTRYNIQCIEYRWVYSII